MGYNKPERGEKSIQDKLDELEESRGLWTGEKEEQFGGNC